MKTCTFTSLIERSILEIYGPEIGGSQFETVPYLDDGDPSSMRTCLGICINEPVHMASVAAQAMLFLAEPMAVGGCDAATCSQIQQDMEDFVILMQLFRIAPYMQWTAVYFPGLTDECETTDGITGAGR